jgi:hypothetical protein
MTTLTLRFNLDDSLVAAYREALPKERENLKKIFERLISNKFRKQGIEEMIQRMDEIGREAEANGLTEELIDEILAEA